MRLAEVLENEQSEIEMSKRIFSVLQSIEPLGSTLTLGRRAPPSFSPEAKLWNSKYWVQNIYSNHESFSYYVRFRIKFDGVGLRPDWMIEIIREDMPIKLGWGLHGSYGIITNDISLYLTYFILYAKRAISKNFNNQVDFRYYQDTDYMDEQRLMMEIIDYKMRINYGDDPKQFIKRYGIYGFEKIEKQIIAEIEQEIIAQTIPVWHKN